MSATKLSAPEQTVPPRPTPSLRGRTLPKYLPPALLGGSAVGPSTFATTFPPVPP